MSTAEKIYRELRRLPEPLVEEVMDFVAYLEFKHGLRDAHADDLKAAQEPAMRRVWDNSADDVWNDL